MAKSERKQINVDLEVYEILTKKADETGTTLNNAIRAGLGLEIKALSNGRPKNDVA